MSLLDVDGYLTRIGASAGDSLDELHRAHLRSVPFENLSVHLGEPISLSPVDLADKIVHRRRGGFCYELNGLFALLLVELGYPVELRSARVHGEHGYGPPLDHLALLVGDRLVDVGFGAHSTYPLWVGTEADQPDPGGVFRVVGAPHGELAVSRDGRPSYLVESRPYELADFTAMCWWQSHAPGLAFTTSLVCSRLTDTGRVTLSGRSLIETTNGERRERVLDSDVAVLAAYREHFGVALDRVPEISAAPAATGNSG